MAPRYKVGDLVQFDSSHMVGVVIKIKNNPAFHPAEKIADILVRWIDGEEFWCLDFTLRKLENKNEKV